jgi:aspartyl-tRNA(Asn)/glutamyl-tRNA(Gln) amidotransferase subunit C
MTQPPPAPGPRTTLETVLQVAALARLELDAAEAAALAPQLDAILAQFQVLTQLDLTGVEPMVTAAAGENVLRDDRPQPSLPADAVLACAPARVGDFYRVPKTVGGDP